MPVHYSFLAAPFQRSPADASRGPSGRGMVSRRFYDLAQSVMESSAVCGRFETGLGGEPIQVAANVVADWLQSKAKDRMTEILNAVPQIDVVYGHNDPMAVGAYLAAKDKGREKEMIFVGVDGLSGEAGGIEKVKDGVLAATFIYPLCVDQAVAVGSHILQDPNFKPDKVYTIPSQIVTAGNAAQLLDGSK